MKSTAAFLWLSSVSACTLFGAADAAEIDARPPNRLTLTASGSEQDDVDDGGTGSLNYIHYVTPGFLFGIGAEHQWIADSTLTFGSARAAFSRGEPASRTTFVGEAYYGDGDDDGRKFDYSVYVFGLSQAVTGKLSLELEAREIDIDTTHGTLPKLGITYLWTPRLVTNVAYAHSVGDGNLGTELTTARIDYYGTHVNLKAGGATGEASPAVLVLQPGVTLPPTRTRQGYVGIGKTFRRCEVLLLGDYLETGEAEKVTLTLSFTAFMGSRGGVK